MSTQPLKLFAAALLLSLAASSAHASLAQLGTKLVGSGATGAARQGSSVALSSDGNTAIVGGSQDNGGAGAAWVYARSGTAWAPQGSKLVGTAALGAADQGASVALSADGNTALVGGFFDNTNVGAVWVYVRSGGSWFQQAKIVGSGGVGATYQGVSVALSADGNTALVGGYFDNSNVGAAWVFTRGGTVWTQQGTKLVGSGAAGQSYQGISVSLSADGNTAAVGGYQDNATAGAAWVYTRSGGVWTQQGAKLVGTGAIGAANQGVSVALSGDGNTLAVGGYFDNSSVGAAWVYTRSGGVWTQQGAKLVPIDETGGGSFGYALHLSSDGNLLLATGFTDNTNTGAAWTFARNAGAWSQQGAKLVGSGAIGAAGQGVSSALSADGQTALVGGGSDNSNAGAAWVFGDPAPKFVSVTDVPNDQGGKVSLRWTADLQDHVPNNPIDAYWIWRQVPTSMALAPRKGLGAATESRAFRSTVEAGQIYYWEFVASQPSHGFPGYSYTAPTTADSVANSNPYTLFMVESEQTSTGKYWSSDPDSGYSVDNLAPNTPTAFAANYSANATHLHWAENTEADLAGYRLYRGSSAAFLPSPGNLVSAQADTGFADAGPAGSYYKVSAVDIHGNESGDALVTPDATTAVGTAPIAFALERLASPAVGGRFTARFTLPGDARATLEVIDVTGRALVRREVRGAGSHAVALGDGRPFGAGVYFVRLVQGARSATARVVVLD